MSYPVQEGKLMNHIFNNYNIKHSKIQRYKRIALGRIITDKEKNCKILVCYDLLNDRVIEKQIG